jgi:hypothetical protein
MQNHFEQKSFSMENPLFWFLLQLFYGKLYEFSSYNFVSHLLMRFSTYAIWCKATKLHIIDSSISIHTHCTYRKFTSEQATLFYDDVIFLNWFFFLKRLIVKWNLSCWIFFFSIQLVYWFYCVPKVYYNLGRQLKLASFSREMMTIAKFYFSDFQQFLVF